jgi:ABC-type transport system involved in multi-copper enzyme maturation permease subunit
MNTILLVIGLILIICSTIMFSLIGVFNQNIWMNFTYHIIITLSGFIMLSLGIISMILFVKEKKSS